VKLLFGALRTVRFEFLVGASATLAALLVVAPALFLAERRLESELVEATVEDLRFDHRVLSEGMSDRLAVAERSVVRYARRISEIPPGVDPAMVAEFERDVGLDPDGARRTKRESYLPTAQAGIWIPKYVGVDDEMRTFYARARHVTEES